MFRLPHLSFSKLRTFPTPSLNSCLPPLLLAAALSACGSSAAPPSAAPAGAEVPAPVFAFPLLLSFPTPPAQAQIIQRLEGQLSGERQVAVTLKAGAQALSSVSTDAAGRFTLPLPSGGALSTLLRPIGSGLLSDLGCLGQLSSSDAAAHGYDVQTLHTPSARYMNAAVSQALLGRALNGRVYLYADRSTAVQGTLDCRAVTHLPTPVTVNLNLSKGWNVLTLTLAAGLSPDGFSVKGQLDNGSDSLTSPSTWTDQAAVQAQLTS